MNSANDKRRTSVSAVSFLNARPFIYGLESNSIREKINITTDSPALCAQKLRDGLTDIGLVPVAAIPAIPSGKIISPYCIGANGPVKSVLLLSNVPLTDIGTILLDYHSRTSVTLARILASRYWEVAPSWINASKGFEALIGGNTAAVVIGDKALQLHDKFKYAYDLSEEWHAFTGKPFVFACWVTIRKLNEDFLNEFTGALQYGISHIPGMLYTESNLPVSIKEASAYLENFVDYNLDEEKVEAMDLFLELMNEVETI